MVFNTLGRLMVVLAALLVLPLACALVYRETATVAAFFGTAAASLAVGFLLKTFVKPTDAAIYARDGFAIVALVWLCMSAIGAVPFVLAGGMNYIDAFFETVSGLTTTGASIISDLDNAGLSHGLLFWRSFTHFLGGMGVLVLVMAIVPNLSDRSIHIMRAEMPGPVVGKIVPRAKDTAKILYLIYIFLTVLETVLLLCGGMPFFESLLYAFGTAGTGGFGLPGLSLGSCPAYIQWVVTVFMLLFGVNFNLYFLLLIRRFSGLYKSTELRVYLGIVVSAAVVITANIAHLFPNLGDAVRHAFFQVAALVTTTGYATRDFTQWPGFSRGLIFLLMFVGGCAGSTAGGLKLSRVILLFKMVAREFKRMVHPRSVASIKIEGKSVDEPTLYSINTYFVLYALCLAASFFALSLFDPHMSFEANVTAAVSCFNNVGPGLAEIGPMSSYAAYSGISKVLLSFVMLLGRLEVFPLLVIFFPSTWRRSR